MADGSLTITLDDETIALLESAAAEAGEAPNVFANRLLVGALQSDRWAIANARIDEYERTGVAENAEVVFERIRNRIHQRLADSE